MSRRPLALCWVTLALAGCDFDADLDGWRCAHGLCGAPADSGEDGGRDDAGRDAGADAGLDAGTDAGIDGGFDAGVDAGYVFDAGVFAPDGSYNFAFVTSVAVSPTQIDPRRADALCAECARDAGLPGVFGAWLAMSDQPAFSRIGMDQVRGWVRPDGLPFADQPGDLVSAINFYPLRLDEHGVDVGQQVVLGGAYLDGNPNQNCNDWTKASAMQSVGCSSCGGWDWTGHDTVSCTVPGRLYCFGVDQNAPVKLTPRSGPLVFTSSDWIEDGGLAGADEHCNFDAARLDAGSGFIALLATQTAGASSRLVFDGGWVRRDGVWVGDLRSANLFAPILIRFTGSYVGQSVATGALAPGQPGTLTTTCDDYHAPVGTFTPAIIQGNTVASGPSWFDEPGNLFACGEFGLLCAQP